MNLFSTLRANILELYEHLNALRCYPRVFLARYNDNPWTSCVTASAKVANLCSFYDKDAPIYTMSRFLPPSKITNSNISRSIIGDGCVVRSGCTVDHSVVGLRALINEGCTIRDSLIMGADYFETLEECALIPGCLPMGIGMPPSAFKHGHIIMHCQVCRNCGNFRHTCLRWLCTAALEDTRRMQLAHNPHMLSRKVLPSARNVKSELTALGKCCGVLGCGNRPLAKLDVQSASCRCQFHGAQVHRGQERPHRQQRADH